MSARGDIHVNEVPTDYQWHLVQTPDYDILTGLNLQVVSTMVITWGNPFIPYPTPGAHGISITIDQRYDTATATWTWIATLITQWGNYTHTGGGSIPATALLKMLGVELVVDINTCDWAFKREDLKFFLNGIDLFDLSPLGSYDTGSGFDLRLDSFDMNGGPVIAVIESEVCTAHQADQYTGTILAELLTVGGYQYSVPPRAGTWTSDTFSYKLMEPTTPPDCDICEDDLPCIRSTDIACITNVFSCPSWDTWLYSRARNVVSTEAIASGSCPCPPGCLGTQTYEQWFVVIDTTTTSTRIRGMPNTSGILETQYHDYTRCNDDEDLDEGDPVVESTTLSNMYRTVDRRITKTACQALSEACACPEHTASPPQCGPDLPDNIECHYVHTVWTTWPSLPSCQPPENGSTHMCRSKYFGSLFAVRVEDLMLRVWRFDPDPMDVVLEVGTFGTAPSWPQIAHHPNGQLGIVFVLDETIKYTVNSGYSEEGIWTTPVDIASGVNCAYAIDEKWKIEYVAIYATDGWYLWMLTEDDTVFQSIGLIATTATDDASAGLEVSPGAMGELAFVYNDGGTYKRLRSSNQGDSWS